MQSNFASATASLHTYIAGLTLDHNHAAWFTLQLHSVNYCQSDPTGHPSEFPRQLSVLSQYHVQFQLADNQVKGCCGSTLIHFDEITSWVRCYFMRVKVTVSGPKTLLWAAPMYLSVLDFLIFMTWIWDFCFRSFSHAVATEGMILLSLEIQRNWISTSSLSSQQNRDNVCILLTALGKTIFEATF